MTDFDLFRFVPFRLNRLSAEVSAALSEEYRARYGFEIPEWRVLATLGFRNASCSAQFIVESTRTHKSTISRAVTNLLARGLLERIESSDDRRAFELKLSRAGRKLFDELWPRLVAKESEMLSCLSPQERKQLAVILNKLETNFDLPTSSQEEDCK
ncbi:MAG: MarR family transcriptional regulator [Bradyrhizobiaceae bacterium PARB1]|nr:MAG: MarR family transcriptional regulator [Bradyrhizobiaceae bacterium PARB1]